MQFGPKLNAFLAAIRVMPNVTRAAAAAGMDKSHHYAKLQSSEEYREAFEVAFQMGCDALSDVAVERAQLGWDEPIVYKGGLAFPEKWDPELERMVPDYEKQPLCVRKIDNNLLQFVLKSRHPAYREERGKPEAADSAAPPLIIQTYPEEQPKEPTNPPSASS